MGVLEELVADPQKTVVGGLDERRLLEQAKRFVDPIAKANSVLDEIHVDGLTPSQVWGQVKLVIDGVNERVWGDEWEDESEADSQTSGEEEEELGEIEESEESGQSEESENEEQESEEVYESAQEGELGSDAEFFGADEENESDSSDVDVAPAKDAFGLNDQFFSIDDFNKQVMDMEGDNSEIDLDVDDEESDDEIYHYDDFFKQQVEQKEQKKQKAKKQKAKKQKAVAFDLNEDDYDAAFDSVLADYNSNTEQLSTFEKQQLKLQQEIQGLEAEAIKDKEWQMKGEAEAKHRAADSLLEEELDFDRAAKPVPVITQESTETIEEIIKRRIKERNYDELKRRVVSELNDFRPSKKVEVSEEKSSKSLAEIYEEDYLGKQDDASSAELKQAHDEISVLFDKLNHQLDSLSSAHFVPKPKERQLEIKVQTSSISMEDAQPLTMSTAQALAPQEVYKPVSKVGKNEVMLKSGVVMSKEELSREEKQRLRRAKKRKQHNERREEGKKKRVQKSDQQ
ncbi:hypothetical protein OGAPHI_005077 [Ogataea philodendri]|uniref:Uncharacterized protein n=1 Tax=Ogataea philodendri TaxID=1378263 RepID=A0A9P8T2H6_9ASCO|nr:uncharacterized protein OGAPHI_005077 [Ogataea philodendri]KAH3663676.1 hypothetical protein OGAPHI_005077 [Ogataea philodendri]